MKKTDTRNRLRTITANNFITACGLSNISLKARKLLYIAISQCKQNDTEFFEYEISVQDFAYLMNIDASNVYKVADNLTDELLKGIIKIEDEKGNWSKYTLFTRCDYDNKNYKIYFKLNPDMTNFFIGLKKNFTQPLLADFLKMRSQYSMEIWHLMQREMHSKKPGLTNKIEFDLSLKELRQVTNCEDKFKQVGQFKDKVLDKAIREIWDNCGVDISYKNIKTGRTVVGFTFTAVSIFHIEIESLKHSTKSHN